MITENLEQVRKNIEEACRAVNRDPGEVTLISVSKTKPVSMLQKRMMQVQETLEKIRFGRSWINIHSSRQIFAGI